MNGQLFAPQVQVGDQVLVYGGPNHLRHGEVIDTNTAKVLSGAAFDLLPTTHAVLRFRTRSGKPAKKRTRDGSAWDLVPKSRLSVWKDAA